VVLSPRLGGYDNLILDLDGCVYVGDEPTPGAVEAIDELRAAGKGVAFVTNNPRHSGEDYVRRLWRMGIRASLADVVTVGGATQHLLAETRPGRTAFVIGTEAMRKHVGDAGLRVLNGSDTASRAEVVVVGGTEDLVYDDLKQASLAVRAGADFVAAGRDSTYPTQQGLWPGTGAILAAVECASGRNATIVDRLGPGRTLVVGDRLDADVAAAARLRLDAALVLTGATDAEEAAAAEDPAPALVAASLAALVRGAG
jgi:HAD superfamily hydrolase (TIGR01450 family)